MNPFRILSLAPAAVLAVALPLAAQSDAQGVAESGALSTLSGSLPALYQRSAESATHATFEYVIHPFYEGRFESQEEFEAWLDEIGAGGFVSAMHMINNLFDASDDTRLFLRAASGSTWFVDSKIEPYGIPVMAPPDVWVPRQNEMGAEGGRLTYVYDWEGKSLAVSERGTVDGELLTWEWAFESVGPRAGADAGRYKKAANRLARAGFVPVNDGLSADGDELFAIGLAETTPGKRIDVKLKLKRIKISTSRKKLQRLINKQGRKGFRMAHWFFPHDDKETRVVFARETVNGRRYRRDCVLVPVTMENPGKMLDALNEEGANGREQILVLNVGNFQSPHFLLCSAE